VGNFAINDGSSGTIAAPVCIPVVLREEPNVVTFADDNNGDSRIDLQFFASVCEKTKVKLLLQKNAANKLTFQTFELWEESMLVVVMHIEKLSTFFQDFLELSLRDAIWEINNVNKTLASQGDNDLCRK
jgi:hypothetical protein